MLVFSANDPFPDVCFARVPYSEILRHSQAVDAWLGFNFEKIESTLSEMGSRTRPPGASLHHQQLWFGLAAQSLLTPYVEIRALLSRLGLKPGQKVVDLGAAYGRMGFVIERLHSGVHFTGYEYVGERVREAQRVLQICHGRPRSAAKKSGEPSLASAAAQAGVSEIQMRHADLSSKDFRPCDADVYFIYDYGTLKAIEKTLYDLRRIAEARSELDLPLLVARGRHSRMLIEARHPWLQKAFAGEGEGRTTIYKMVLGRTQRRLPDLKREDQHPQIGSVHEFEIFER